MNSEISLIASDKFIQKFVYAIIQSIRARNFVYEKRHVIHADLVPRVSERVMHASLGEGTANRPLRWQTEAEPLPDRGEAPARPALPVRLRPVRAPVAVRGAVPTRAPPIAPAMSLVVPAIVPKGAPVESGGDYGKIAPLLGDASVSTIECQGAGKPVMIIRAGQRQLTKIVLSAEEIKGILDKVSDEAHIPLLEGVFRAAVGNFSISAVISGIVGSRFVIKKANAYAMLEGKT